MKQLPYTILIDSAEQKPFTFSGIHGDSYYQNQDLVVPTKHQHLGISKADYSIDGLEGRIHIERKSMEDAQSTVLGWPSKSAPERRSRRERFMDELLFLSSIEFGAIVIEATEEDMMRNAPQYGEKTAQLNAKIMYRQILAWRMDHKVQWIFCWNRRAAELATFRLLDRFYRRYREVNITG